MTQSGQECDVEMPVPVHGQYPVHLASYMCIVNISMHVCMHKLKYFLAINTTFHIAICCSFPNLIIRSLSRPKLVFHTYIQKHLQTMLIYSYCSAIIIRMYICDKA